MLLPQTLTAWDLSSPVTNSYIEIVYRAYDTATGEDITGYTKGATMHDNSAAPTNLYVKAGFPINDTWLMGKAYKYVLTLGDTQKSGGYVTETNFINENGQGTGTALEDPQDDQRIYEVGDRVNATGPIGFYVEVGDWEPDPATGINKE